MLYLSRGTFSLSLWPRVGSARLSGIAGFSDASGVDLHYTKARGHYVMTETTNDRIIANSGPSPDRADLSRCDEPTLKDAINIVQHAEAARRAKAHPSDHRWIARPTDTSITPEHELMLIDKALRGDESDRAEFFAWAGKALLAWITHEFAGNYVADDIDTVLMQCTQEILENDCEFLRKWQPPVAKGKGRRLGSWMRLLAKRRAIDHIRKRQLEKECLSGGTVDCSTPEDQGENGESIEDTNFGSPATAASRREATQAIRSRLTAIAQSIGGKCPDLVKLTLDPKNKGLDWNEVNTALGLTTRQGRTLRAKLMESCIRQDCTPSEMRPYVMPAYKQPRAAQGSPSDEKDDEDFFRDRMDGLYWQEWKRDPIAETDYMLYHRRAWYMAPRMFNPPGIQTRNHNVQPPSKRVRYLPYMGNTAETPNERASKRTPKRPRTATKRATPRRRGRGVTLKSGFANLLYERYGRGDFLLRLRAAAEALGIELNNHRAPTIADAERIEAYMRPKNKTTRYDFRPNVFVESRHNAA